MVIYLDETKPDPSASRNPANLCGDRRPRNSSASNPVVDCRRMNSEFTCEPIDAIRTDKPTEGRDPSAVA